MLCGKLEIQSRGGNVIFTNRAPKLLSCMLLREYYIHYTCQHFVSLALIQSIESSQ